MYTLHKLPEGFIVTSDEKYEGERCKTLEEYYSKFYSIDCGNTEELIIAQEPNIIFSALKEEEQKIIGWFNVEKLALECYPINEFEDEFDYRFRLGFKEGFQKAQELLSDKVFTTEDMFKLLDLMRHVAKTSSNLAVMEVEGRRLIESLSKKSWSVELEMEEYDFKVKDSRNYLPIKPKLIDGKIKILKLL